MHLCILTTVHSPFDTRILEREALSLVKAGHKVTLIAPHTKEEIVSGVRVLPVPRYSDRRLYDVHEHYPNAILSKEWIAPWLRGAVSLGYRAFESLAVPLMGHLIYTTPLVGERYRRMRCKSVRVDNFPTANFVGEWRENASVSPNRARRIIYRAGRRTFLERYNWEIAEKTLLEFYRDSGSIRCS